MRKVQTGQLLLETDAEPPVQVVAKSRSVSFDYSPGLPGKIASANALSDIDGSRRPGCSFEFPVSSFQSAPLSFRLPRLAILP